MSRKYTKVEQLAEGIRRLHEEGKTYREIGEQYGLTKKQVADLMKRQRRKQRLIEHGYLIRPKGRPRKEPEDDAVRVQNELARLRMQVELLQNFLYEVGRR